jgi:hypothetical protein
VLLKPLVSKNSVHLTRSQQKIRAYYNGARTQLSLNKDAPFPRAVQAIGRILPTPILGGYTINMFGFDFRHGHPLREPKAVPAHRNAGKKGSSALDA